MMAPIAERGRNLGGLLRYLFGPGRREEHTDPRIVAAWTGAGDVAALQPPVGVGGRRDFARLVAVLEAPLLALEGGRVPARPVWHCALRTAPGDRELSGRVTDQPFDRTARTPHPGRHRACSSTIFGMHKVDA